MTELRLEYVKEKGVNIEEIIQLISGHSGACLELRECNDLTDYIEWLEERLLDDEALFVLMNKILHEKNKANNH